MAGLTGAIAIKNKILNTPQRKLNCSSITYQDRSGQTWKQEDLEKYE